MLRKLNVPVFIIITTETNDGYGTVTESIQYETVGRVSKKTKLIVDETGQTLTSKQQVVFYKPYLDALGITLNEGDYITLDGVKKYEIKGMQDIRDHKSQTIDFIEVLLT